MNGPHYLVNYYCSKMFAEKKSSDETFHGMEQNIITWQQLQTKLLFKEIGGSSNFGSP